MHGACQMLFNPRPIRGDTPLRVTKLKMLGSGDLPKHPRAVKAVDASGAGQGLDGPDRMGIAKADPSHASGAMLHNTLDPLLRHGLVDAVASLQGTGLRVLDRGLGDPDSSLGAILAPDDDADRIGRVDQEPATGEVGSEPPATDSRPETRSRTLFAHRSTCRKRSRSARATSIRSDCGRSRSIGTR